MLGFENKMLKNASQKWGVFLKYNKKVIEHKKLKVPANSIEKYKIRYLQK